MMCIFIDPNLVSCSLKLELHPYYSFQAIFILLLMELLLLSTPIMTYEKF